MVVEKKESVERKKKTKKKHSCSQLSNCGRVQRYKCLCSYLCYLYPCMRLRTDTRTHTCQSTHLPCTREVALTALRLQAAIQMSLCVTSHFFLLVLPMMSLLLLFSPIGWSYDSLTPGCHLHPFNVTIRSDRRGTCKGTHLVYACVGYCESSAFPSRYSVLVASNFTHNITSTSRCCTISKDAKVKVRLDCPRGRHHDEIEILTAKACRCDMCRKSRY